LKLTEVGTITELEARVQAAENLLRDGRHPDAFRAYTSLLEDRVAWHTSAGSALLAADLILLERTAELAVLFGNVDAADDLLHVAADHAQLKRAEMRAGAGDMRAAFNLLAEMAPRIGDLNDIDIDPQGLRDWERRIEWRHIAHAEVGSLLTRCYVVMGQVLLSLGRCGDTMAVCERGIFHADAATASDLARRSHWKLSFLHARAMMERGDLNAARVAAEVLGPTLMGSLPPAAHVQWLELLGKMDFLQGRLGDSTRHLRTALTICAECGFTRAYVDSALNLAHSLVLLNRIDHALELAVEADRMARELGDDCLALRCAALRQLAVARRSSMVEAVSAALSVREMVESPASIRGSMTARPATLPAAAWAAGILASFEERALAFQWELGSSTEAAKSTLHVMRETFAHTDSRIVAARFPALEGLLHVASGDHASAAVCFGTALDSLTALGLVPECWQAMHMRACSLMRMNCLDEAAELSTRADALLESLAGSLDASARALYLLNKSSIEEEHLSVQVESLVRGTLRARNGSMRARLAARMQVWQRLLDLLDHLDRYRATLADRQLTPELTIDAANPRVRSEPPRQVTWLWRLVRQPRDQATIVFIVLPDRLIVVWLAFLRTGYAISPVTRIALRGAVRQWHEHAQSALDVLTMTPEQRAAHDGTGDEMLARLADMLRLDAALVALPAHVRRLAIVADDVLHGCPFAALRRAGAYLVERYALSMAFHSAPQGALNREITNSLVVGVAGDDDETRIPQVAEECRQAAAWFTRQGVPNVPLLEAHALCDTVEQRLAEAGAAHLACHGSFEPEQPDQSGVLLADGILSIRRIASLRLRRCRLVMLTSCWSADSFVLPGRWIISLPEVLWRCGAQSIVGSLWGVVDDVAAPFIDRLYSSLERLPLDQALREVQLACLVEPDFANQLVDLPVRSPYFWAGYQVYGNTATIQCGGGRLPLPKMKGVP
jgi:CHAT domain-containing protein